jgi:hypothetical protein
LDDGGMPVFTPNWEEFESFAKFIEEVEVRGRGIDKHACWQQWGGGRA